MKRIILRKLWKTSKQEKISQFLFLQKINKYENSDQDYSAYLENEKLIQNNKIYEQDSLQEIKLIRQTEKLGGKNKNQIKFNKIGAKPEPNPKSKPGSRNHYERNKLLDVSEGSDECSYAQRKGGREDERRVHTDWDQYVISNKPYQINQKRRFKEDVIRNKKKDKISMKIKRNRRKINENDIPYSIDQNNYEEDLQEANKIINSNMELDAIYDDDQPFQLGIKEDPDESKEMDYPQKYLNPQMYVDPIDEESFELDDNTFSELNYIQSSISSEDLKAEYVEEFDEEDLDEEDLTFQYINEYVIKMDEDIKEMHSRQVNLRKEAIESCKQIQQECVKLNDWKKKGIAKIKNYKIALKEIINQYDEKWKEVTDLIETNKSEIDRLLLEKAKIMKEWREDQENWKRRWEEDVSQAKEEFEYEFSIKENEFRHKIIDYEGQIEDLNRELNSLRNEKSSMIRKYKAEFENMKNIELQISVRSWVENMLDIWELKEIIKENKTKIKTLEEENKNLRKQSTSTKRKIIIKSNNPVPKLNISDISLSKIPSNNKFKAINKSSITIAGKQKIKLSKGKVKNFNNFSHIETNEDSWFESKIIWLETDLKVLVSEKNDIK